MAHAPIDSQLSAGPWRWIVDLRARLRRFGAETASDQTPRAFVWFVVAFAAGILIYFSWTEEPLPLTGGIIGIPGAGLWLIARRAHMSTGVRVIAVALVAMGLGHLAAELRTIRVNTPLLLRPLAMSEVRGRVVAAEQRPNSGRVVLENVTLADRKTVELPIRVRLSLTSKNGLPAVGDYIAVKATLRPPMRPVLPDAFAFHRFLYFERIGGVGTVFGPWQVLAAPPQDDWSDPFLLRVEATRRAIANRIAEIIPDRDTATVSAAMVMGEQGAIPEDLQQAYRTSGLAHLLSISGVHMSILAAVIFFLVRRGLALVPALALRLDTKKIAAVTAWGMTTVYLLISGASVPAVRSYLMIAVVLVAILLDRTAISIRTVAWAALVLMAIYPDALLGASFQMSFMAVLALVAIAEHVQLQAKWRTPDGEFQIVRAMGLILAGLVVTDIAAGGATALFAIYHFNRFPSYSMVSNLLAAPITSLWVMPWGLVATTLMPLGLDEIPFKLMGAGIALVNGIARLVAAWPGAQIHVPPMHTVALGVAALGLIAFCVGRGRGRWIGVVLIVGGLIQPWLATPPDVIMDEDAGVVAVTDEDGALMLRPGRGDRFIREAWQDRYGASPVAWPTEGQNVKGLQCDDDGCILTRNGQRLLIAFHDAALVEDCDQVDAVVSMTATRALCARRDAVDRLVVRERGTVAVWLRSGALEQRFAGDNAGERPWSLMASRTTNRRGRNQPRPPEGQAVVAEENDPANSAAAIPPDVPAP